MKIVLSTDAIHHPLTGIGRYTLELAKEFSNRADASIVYFNGSQLVEEVSIPQPPPEAPAPRHPLIARAVNSLPIRPLFRQVKRYQQLRRLRSLHDHVFHGTNYSIPAFPGPTIATIHDLSVLKWPEFHPTDRVKHIEKAIKRTLTRVDRLITDSEFTRREVAENLSWPLDRIDAIHLGVREQFRPRNEDDIEHLLKQHGLRYQSYSLYSGTIEPRKNLSTLLDAYQMLPDTTRRSWPLVLCGDPGWHSQELLERIRHYQQQGWLLYLGYVPEEELVAIMSGARVFVFPTRYEGFGLPVLEAMASGVPTVCSTAESLLEVTDGAAATVDAMDVESLARAISEVLEDGPRRKALQQAGLQRAGQFSWKKCAEQTLDSYRRIAR